MDIRNYFCDETGNFQLEEYLDALKTQAREFPVTDPPILEVVE